jgi:hypothetical protein
MEAADFINKLLQRKPANRLGFNSPAEVKNHQWLRDINWQEIIEKKARAPFIPGKCLPDHQLIRGQTSTHRAAVIE